MKKIILIILLSTSYCLYSQISKITVYHYSFFDDFGYLGGPREEQIKQISGTRKYISCNKEFRKEIAHYISKLDSLKDYIPLTGAQDVQLLLEIKYKNGKTKRIYSWSNKEIFYNQKLYKSDEYFVKMIEKYFPNEISWSNIDIDHKN